ncbi:MAG: hypothetical protein IJ727_06840 [Treponema sp.]|nr:hypothetical protein [Treponema sp.]
MRYSSGAHAKEECLLVSAFYLHTFYQNQQAYVSSYDFAGFCPGPLLDGLFDAVGYVFLTIPTLSDFFGNLFEIPFVAFTKFNNSVVMGSFLCGLVFYIPAYFIARLFVFLWCKYITNFMRRTKITKVIAKLPLVSKIASLVEDE